MTPVLPPEDYQALINQGVKPEDIILNLNDDTDAESDVSLNDSGCNNLSNEFVFPDEATTAKLLAVNTATKNLKRQASNISGAAATSNTTLKLQNNETELTEFFDCNEASTSSSAFIAAAGYSTRLFYGSTSGPTSALTTIPHKSVIVSPQSHLNRIVNIEKINGENSENSGAEVNNVVANVGNEVTGSNTNAGGNNVEDVNNLQAISSNETKKARRVQKTTRCLSNSSGKRK